MKFYRRFWGTELGRRILSKASYMPERRSFMQHETKTGAHNLGTGLFIHYSRQCDTRINRTFSDRYLRVRIEFLRPPPKAFSVLENPTAPSCGMVHLTCVLKYKIRSRCISSRPFRMSHTGVNSISPLFPIICIILVRRTPQRRSNPLGRSRPQPPPKSSGRPSSRKPP